MTTVLGIIGGSGVYDIDGLENPQWITVESPFGDPSDDLLVGTLDGVKIITPSVCCPYRYGRKPKHRCGDCNH